jgi:hypothetical protein
MALESIVPAGVPADEAFTVAVADGCVRDRNGMAQAIVTAITTTIEMLIWIRRFVWFWRIYFLLG